MSNKDYLLKQAKAPEPYMLKTVMWIGVGILIYVVIQWMLPKLGSSS